MVKILVSDPTREYDIGEMVRGLGVPDVDVIHTSDRDEARKVIDQGGVHMVIASYDFSKAGDGHEAISFIRGIRQNHFFQGGIIFLDYPQHQGVSREADKYVTRCVYKDEVNHGLPILLNKALKNNERTR